VVEHEGNPDVVQLSGGEPTIHPDFFDILDYATTLPIRHIMINTNGIRIATDEQFVEKLSQYSTYQDTGIEIYLQFDSFKEDVLLKMRGKNLIETRKKCVDILNKLNIHTTLVATIEKNSNDDEIGKIIDYATTQKCVRGVTFQPTQFAGRNDNSEAKLNKLTLTEVRQSILDQTDIFKPNDILPVPCNPDSIAMGYALKLDGKTIPLTSMVDPSVFLDSAKNTILLEQEKSLQKHFVDLFSTSKSGKPLTENLKTLLCCLPQVVAPNLSYENVFRIIILKFMDAYDFDVRAVKKSCVHIVHKDGRLIPFETMNMFYRDEKENMLKELQKPYESLSYESNK